MAYDYAYHIKHKFTTIKVLWKSVDETKVKFTFYCDVKQTAVTDFVTIPKKSSIRKEVLMYVDAYYGDFEFESLKEEEAK